MRTLALKAIVLCLLCAGLSACGLSWIAEPETNPVIEDRVGLIGRQPVGTLATTAGRRIVLVRIAENDPRLGQFCAEPPPDAAENIANQLTLAVEATAKTPKAEGSGRLELAKQLATNVQTLFHRSQGLQFYRDGMYNLCQSYLNGSLTPEKFVERSGALLDKSHDLISKELDLTQGIIGGPPPAPTVNLQLDADRVRAFRLVTDLENAKQQKQETNARVALFELYNILLGNANLDSNSPQRTMSDDELKAVLDKLRPLAKEASRDKLMEPAQLKALGKREDFQKLFIPFPS